MEHNSYLNHSRSFFGMSIGFDTTTTDLFKRQQQLPLPNCSRNRFSLLTLTLSFDIHPVISLRLFADRDTRQTIIICFRRCRPKKWVACANQRQAGGHGIDGFLITLSVALIAEGVAG